MTDGGLDIAREALLVALWLSTPILAAGLIVGLAVSIAQAVTQIQEQTLSFVPKIAAMILVSIALLGWITAQMKAFAEQMFLG